MGVLGVMLVCACASRNLSLVRLLLFRLLLFHLLQFCLRLFRLLNIFTSIGVFQTLPGTESDSEATGMELI